jgi:hypothetical protein
MNSVISPPTDSFPLVQEIANKIVFWYPYAVEAVKHIFGFLIGISIPISFFFLIGIIYCVENLKLIRNKEALMHDLKVEPAFEEGNAGDTVMAHRWENAMKNVESPNENDWKQAIIDADIILDDLLTKMGYRGESIGEKLKRVATGDMKTLNDAWEAHKVRNDIAHTPGFVLSQHEARQTIARYRRVFEEFFYI